jgi:hypothetical protein
VLARAALPEVRQVFFEEGPFAILERGLAVGGPRPSPALAQPRGAEDLAELPPHVILPGPVRLLHEAEQLRAPDRHLDLDRPGQEDVVERVVLQDGDLAPRATTRVIRRRASTGSGRLYRLWAHQTRSKVSSGNGSRATSAATKRMRDPEASRLAPRRATSR